MKILNEILSWVGVLVCAFVIALVINVFFFQPTSVNGYSMESTLKDKDRLIVSKLPHTFKYEPGYGDIVIVDSRIDRPRTFSDDFTDAIKYNLISSVIFGNKEEIFWVKRVIGKPGDTIEFINGKVYRNGEELVEPYVKEPMEGTPNGEIKVPGNHVFVMGDNRNNSMDSRYVGPIPLDHVMGKSVLKF